MRQDKLNNNKNSVAKGGAAVAGARLMGMVLSFLLFLVLARHSAADAGVFRTVMTYLVIAEFIGILGMHRWLYTEMAASPNRQWSIFIATNTVMLGVAVILIVTYSFISVGGFYSDEINHGLRLATISLIASGIYQCVQCGFVGIGKTHRVGIYNGLEYLARASISILLIYLDYPVVDVIWVFVLCRWVVALAGFYELHRLMQPAKWLPERVEIAHVLKDAPKLLLTVAAFMALRNAALVLIPALVNDAEVAYYAVAYQLYDLILVIPSVLAISSSHLFVNKAVQSSAALRKVSIQFVSITAIFMFPCIAITAAFAYNFLLFLYGAHYTVASDALVLLMLASGVAMLDQALSQAMTSRKDYYGDMLAILAGGLSAVVMTYWLVRHHGATGGATALLLASLITVLIRLQLLRKLLPLKLLWFSTFRPILSTLIMFGLAWLILRTPVFVPLASAKYLWIASVPVFLGLYLIILFLFGGVTPARRESIRKFLFHH